MAKTTFSFTLDGVKYTDIKGYDGTRIYIGLTGTAQMIRQYLKAKYPIAVKRGYSYVNSSGTSIDIGFNRAPEELYKKISTEIERKFQEGYFDGMTDSYVNTKPNETSEEGLVISYGAKYIFTYNSLGGNAPAVDWNNNSKPLKPESQPKPENQQGVEVLKVCSGWKITKRRLSGGKIVYNAKINPDTKKNTTDWNTIKSEIYIETGFKWGKFSSFDKWGQIASEAFVIKRLCEILGKYYTGDTQPETPPQPETTPEPETRLRFPYGESWGVPKEYGNELIQRLFDDWQFSIISNSERKFIEIKKSSGVPDDAWLLINDNGGEFSLETPDGSFLDNIYYVTDQGVKNPKDLAEWINNSYLTAYPSAEEKLEFKVDESYKSLPPNPKLEYLRIEWAEGLIAYADTFPREFQSFTAATKYIADNIGEIPTDGTYEKHKIIWKWKFSDNEQSDRWDIGKDLNPKTHKNLYAYQMVLVMCYNSWRAAETDQGYTATADDFYAEVVGKDGAELNDKEFNDLLNFLIDNYYVDDDWIRIQGRELRLERFKIHYPKVYALYNQPKTQKTRADIEKAIAGLQYLADKGNEKASKAIAGLKYLLK